MTIKRGAFCVLLLMLLTVVLIACLKLGYINMDKNGPLVPIFTKIKVGNETITFGEVSKQKLLIGGVWSQSKFSTNSAYLQKTAEDELIKQKIILLEAKNLNINVSNEEISTETERRAKQVGGTDNLTKVLTSYGWKEQDLRDQIYYQLLEQKVRNMKEEQMHIQAIVYTPSGLQKSIALDSANKTVKLFNQNKDFQQIKDDVLKQTRPTTIVVQFYDQELRGNQINKVTNDPGLLNFYRNLKSNGSDIYITKNGVIISAFMKNRKEGVDFDFWLLQMKESLVKKISILDLTSALIKPVYAIRDPLGTTCGGVSFCASDQNDCGNANYSFCSSGTAPGCRTSGFPVCCISTSGIGGTVRNASTGTLIPGATITGTNTQVCAFTQYNNNTTTSNSSGAYWLGYYNCAGGSVNISTSASGYNSSSFSIAVDNINTAWIDIYLTSNVVPTPKYRCSGTSCIRDDTYGSSTSSTCSDLNNCQQTINCANWPSSVSQNPIPQGASFNIDLIGNFLACGTYQNLGVSAGGATCGFGVTVRSSSFPCDWQWSCTANTVGNFSATFSYNNGAGTTQVNCPISYTINNPCSTTTCGTACSGACGQQTCVNQCGTATINGSCGCVNCNPTAPTLVYPANGASGIPLTVSVIWAAPTSWGYSCSGGSKSYNLYWKASSAGTWNSVLINTPNGNPNTTYPISGLTYGTSYQWYIVATNGAVSMISPTWTFTTMQPAWYQVVGGDISGGGSVTSNVPNSCVNPSCSPYIIKQSP